MESRPPHDDDMENMPTPQELSNELHAVEEAVAAVERDERDQLLQPWTHTPLPGTRSHNTAYDGYSAGPDRGQCLLFECPSLLSMSGAFCTF